MPLNRRFLALSLSIHALLFALLWLRKEQSPSASSEELVQFELLEREQATAPKGGGSTSGGLAAKSPLEKLRPGFSLQDRAQGKFQLAGDENSDDPGVSWGSGSENIDKIADFLPLDRIRDQADGLTSFPSLFRRHDIWGSVNARLVIDSEGCNWPSTQIWSKERHLQIYVLSVLKKLCGLDSVARLTKVGRKNVDFSFSFAFTEDASLKDSSEVRGNIVIVSRVIPKSVMEWRLGPIRGLFPIPAVNIDFDWLKQNWDRYIEGRDPFKEFEKEYSGS